MKFFICIFLVLHVACSNAENSYKDSPEEELDSVFMSDTINAVKSVMYYTKNSDRIDSSHKIIVHSLIMDRWSKTLGIPDSSDYGVFVEGSGGRITLDEVLVYEDSKYCLVKLIYWSRYNFVNEVIPEYAYWSCIERVFNEKTARK